MRDSYKEDGHHLHGGAHLELSTLLTDTIARSGMLAIPPPAPTDLLYSCLYALYINRQALHTHKLQGVGCGTKAGMEGVVEHHLTINNRVPKMPIT